MNNLLGFLMNSVTTGRQPVAIGIINQDDFSSNTIADYLVTMGFGSASISGGSLNLSGGVGLWESDFVAFDKVGSSYRKTCLNSWEQVVYFKNTTVPSATSYGFAVGIMSANPQAAVSILVRVCLDSSGDKGRIKIAHVSGGVVTILATSAPVRVLNNDEYFFSVTLQDNTLSFVITNITNSFQTIIGSYNFLYAAGSLTANNTGRFALSLIGGTQEIQAWNINSNELIKDTQNVFAGDSVTYGAWSALSGSRWPLLAMAGSPSRYTINAGPGDYTQMVVDRLPEILALNPINVVLMIGANDLLFGVPSGTWQANYTNITNTIKAAGIGVVHCLATPRNATDVTPLNAFIAANFTLDTIIDTYTPLWSGVATGLHATYNSGDGVHPNQAGHTLIASTVRAAAPFLYL